MNEERSRLVHLNKCCLAAEAGSDWCYWELHPDQFKPAGFGAVRTRASAGPGRKELMATPGAGQPMTDVCLSVPSAEAIVGPGGFRLPSSGVAASCPGEAQSHGGAVCHRAASFCFISPE